MNRNEKEVAYCQVDAQMSEKYTITRDNYKIKWTQIGNHSSPAFLGRQFIILRKRDPLFSETVFPCFATGAAKHLVCFPLI